MSKKRLEIITVAAFAELMGVTHKAVNKWIDTGKITQRAIQYSPAGKPKIIVDYAVPDLEKNTTPGAVRKTIGGHTLGGVTNKAQKVQAQINDETLDAIKKLARVDSDGTIKAGDYDITADPVDFHDAKIKEQIAKAQLAIINVKEKRKELVSKAEMDLQLRELGITLKSDLATVADRVAANCHAAQSELEVRNIIHAAIEQVLLKYSNKIWE